MKLLPTMNLNALIFDIRNNVTGVLKEQWKWIKMQKERKSGSKKISCLIFFMHSKNALAKSKRILYYQTYQVLLF